MLLFTQGSEGIYKHTFRPNLQLGACSQFDGLVFFSFLLINMRANARTC